MFGGFTVEVTCTDCIGRREVVHAVILVVLDMHQGNEIPNSRNSLAQVREAFFKPVEKVDAIGAGDVVREEVISTFEKLQFIMDPGYNLVLAECMGKRIICVRKSETTAAEFS